MDFMNTLLNKETGMIKTQHPLNYTADNLDYRIFNEERTITQEVDKVIVLDFGAFFTKNLVVRNNATKQTLRLGRDYTCEELDFVATKKSGHEVATRIVIKTDAVKSISYDYMYVGGEHMNGLHLLKALREKYPQGLVNTYEWDKVLNKPETFRPKFHQMHVKELYGFDGASASLSRMVEGIKRGASANTSELMKRVTTHLESTQQDLTESIKEMDALLDKAFEELSVQDGEYIFSDSNVNPSVLRGYGTWVRVTNTILRGKTGEASFAVDAGNVLALGTGQILRNCFVWRNEETKMRPTYVLTSVAHSGYSVTRHVEDRDIIFNLQTTGIVEGGMVGWVLIDASGNVVQRSKLYGAPTGSFSVDASGKASIIVKFKPSVNTAKGNKVYTLRLLHTVDVKVSFTLFDISLEKRVSVAFMADSVGSREIFSVNEGQDFYLNINTVGYATGESIYLDWSYSSILQSAMAMLLPNIISNTSSNKVSIKLRAKENMLTDGLRALVVYVVESLGQAITSSLPTATLTIRDSSQNTTANISFNTTVATNVYEVDEGAGFTINIKTNIPNEEIELLFESTRPLSDFIGLTSLITQDVNGISNINVTNIEDFLTATGTQRLTVIAFYNDIEIGRNQLYFKDTSKSPAYEIFFSKIAGGTTIAQIAEGEKFYFNVKVPGWVKPSNPPVLNFAYLFNSNPGTTKAELNRRLVSALYDSMAFDQSAAVFNGVSWVNGNTLVMEFTAIANRMVDGDDVFSIAIKQHNEQEFTRIAQLTMLDTSIYNISTSFSSSATQLLPITSVDEMQANGLNNIMYLWIDVDGDASLMGDIVLETNASMLNDFVTVFPQTIKFAAGQTRQIIAVTLLADFFQDGAKTVSITGKYKVEHSDRLQEIFNTSIVINDNSVRTPISIFASKSSTGIVIDPGGFSEWYPLYAHLDFPSFAFQSKIKWSIGYPAGNSNQFDFESGEFFIPPNTSKAMIVLNPKRDRVADGQAQFNISATRYIADTGRAISNQAMTTNQILKDDSVPPAVMLKLYSDAARTKEISAVNEGQTVYLRAIVNNPDRNSSIVINLTHQSDTNITVAGRAMLAYGKSSVGSKLTFPSNQLITANYTYSDDFSEYYADVTLTVTADRITNIMPTALAITANLLRNDSNTPVNTAVTPQYIADNLLVANSVQVAIIDTSKTAAYSITAPSTANEGDAFDIKLNISNGTLGDVYYTNIISAFLTTRLDINELGLEQVSVIENDIVTWRFRARYNRFTDTTTGVFTVQIVNKTLGTVVGTTTVNINDNSKTPDFSLSIVNNSLTPISSLIEGNDNSRLYIRALANMDTDEDIRIEWVSGRAADQFPAELFKTHSMGNVINGSGAIVGYGVHLPVRPRFDRRTNTAAENAVTIRATTTISNISKLMTFTINDVSRELAFTASRWVVAGTTNVLSSVNEGQAVELQVQTTGGPEVLDITCTNNGGRNPSKLSVNSYGATRNRNNNATWVSFPFTPTANSITDGGNDLRLSVRLNLAGAVTLDAVLPINDTSNNAYYGVKIIKQGDGSQTPVNFLLENTAYQIIASCGNVPLTASVRLNANNNTYYHGTPINDTITGHGGWPNFVVHSFSLANSVRTPSGNLWYNAKIIVDGVERAVVNLPVVDNAIQQVSGRITATTDINTPISTALTGTTVTFVMDPAAIAGIDWNLGSNHVVRWMLVNANNEAILNNPNAGDSNRTFNAGNLSGVNGGSGYRVNIGLNTALPVPVDAKIIFFEEYVIGGVTQSIRLGSTNTVKFISPASLASITDIYWSITENGDKWIYNGNEGYSFNFQVTKSEYYLMIKTKNVPLGTTINIDWAGSTTNSADFDIGTTDYPTTVKVTNFDAATGLGYGFYRFALKYDEIPG